VLLYPSVKVLGCPGVDLRDRAVRHRKVDDRAAAAAHEMVVRAGIVVKMVNPQQTEAVLRDHAGIRELVQVAVHSAETDVWEGFLHIGVDKLRCRVIPAGL